MFDMSSGWRHANFARVAARSMDGLVAPRRKKPAAWSLGGWRVRTIRRDRRKAPRWPFDSNDQQSITPEPVTYPECWLILCWITNKSLRRAPTEASAQARVKLLSASGDARRSSVSNWSVSRSLLKPAGRQGLDLHRDSSQFDASQRLPVAVSTRHALYSRTPCFSCSQDFAVCPKDSFTHDLYSRTPKLGCSHVL